MSKFTTEVRFICEQAAGLKESVGYDKIDSVLTESTVNKVMPDYPIFDEAYRYQLNKKILKFYYTREIGAETVGLWRLWVDNKMNAIMPYYNQLYESELLKFDPLSNYKVVTKETVTHSGVDEIKSNGVASHVESQHANTESNGAATANNADNTTTSSSVNDNNKVDFTGNNRSVASATNNTDTQQTQENKNANAYSDTPQGGINGVANLNYLTNYREVKDVGNSNTTSSAANNSVADDVQKHHSEANGTTTNESEQSSSGVSSSVSKGNVDSTLAKNSTRSNNQQRNKSFNSVDSYVREVSGKSGEANYSKLLLDFRKTLLNIDMMIIEELNPLFFGLWE